MKGLTFVPEMAIAALEGRKTVTRRVIVPQPVSVDSAMWHMWRVEYGPCGHYFFSDAMAPDIVRSRCDYKAGERRCLLTTWAFGASFDRIKPKELDETFRWWHAGQGPKPDWCGKSRPGRFLPNHLRPRMPVFEIVSVRAERVQEITEADAKAEGAQIQKECNGGQWIICGPRIGNYREGFRWLWNSINDDRGYGWDANPWVWRVEFKRA